MALKYPNGTVVRATVDDVADTIAIRVQENEQYGFWLSHNGKPGPITRFDREVTDITPLVLIPAVDVSNMLATLAEGNSAVVVEYLEDALEAVLPTVEEPLGLGAVVTDVWGETFVRIPEAEGDELPWYSVNGYYVGWYDIVEPTVESAGAPVAPPAPPVAGAAVEEPVVE